MKSSIVPPEVVPVGWLMVKPIELNPFAPTLPALTNKLKVAVPGVVEETNSA